MADQVDDLADLELLDEDGFLSEDEDGADSVSLGSGSSNDDNDSDSDDEPREITEEHYKALRATVVDIVTALGGLEDIALSDGSIETVYAIGDDCLRCLRDLRSLLHQDQDDAMRTVPRIFGEVNVVQRGLLPLLLKTADMGERGSKIALACTDLITSLTWPVDVAAEQQALLQKDGNPSSLESLSHIQHLLVSYKAAILRARSGETRGSQRSVLSTILLHVLLPSFTKPRRQRSERDTGTISMCLHLFRNLVAIKDPIATSLSSTEQIALSNLQNDLLIEMHQAHILDTMLMLASNAESRDYEAWNVVAAEFVLRIFAGANPACLLPAKATTASTALSGASAPSSALQRSLMSEAEAKRSNMLSAGASRHSRYTTSINFLGADGEVRLATSQSALRKDSERLNQLWKEKTTRNIRRRKKMDEAGALRRRAPWSSQTVKLLSKWAQQFLEVGFESLVRSVVKDVRTESAKAGDLAQTRTRIMQLSTFFLEFFLLLRQSEAQHSSDGLCGTERNGAEAQDKSESYPKWTFSLISYWLEPWALKMAWMRAANAREDKAWLEFVTAVQLWTALLRVVEALGKSKNQADVDRAEGIQAIHFYDELALDAAKAITKTYTTQSFRCLETIIDFSHIIPRLLERYSKDKDNLYIKVKRQMSRKDADGDSSDQQQVQRAVDDQIKERKFEFEKFQAHICSSQLIIASLSYLARWREITEDVEEHIASVVHILHRLVVKAGCVRLLFPYRHRMTLRTLQQDASLWLLLQNRAVQTAADATKLIKYVLSKFDRLDESEKGMWGEGMKMPKPVKVFKMPAEIEITPSRGHADDVRIAVGLLVEKGLTRVVSWVKSGIEEAARTKEAIVREEKEEAEEAALTNSDGDGEGDEEAPRSTRLPVKAFERFDDFKLSYHENDTMREDASTRPEVKLLCRLLGFRSKEDDDHHWIWTIPAEAMPSDLETDADLLDDAVRFPYETLGERFETFVSRVRKAPARHRVTVNENGDEEEVHVPRGRGARKNARQNTWLDDDLIEDSDEEMEAVARLMQDNGHDTDAVPGRRNGNDSNSSSPVPDASSSRRGHESSATSPSVHSPSSEARIKSLKKRKRILRPKPRQTNALFLGSDSEGDEEHQQRDEREDSNTTADREAEASEAGSQRAQSLHKRRMFIADSDGGSDDEANEGNDENKERKERRRRHADPAENDENYDNDLVQLSGKQAALEDTTRIPLAPLTVTTTSEDGTAGALRKRRAVVLDDDDDEAVA